MSLGMEVDLRPGDFVFDWDPAPLRKRGRSNPLFFGPRPLWTNGWTDQDGTWHGGGVRSSHTALHGDPARLPTTRGRGPNFRPISIVAKRLDGSRCDLVWR